jgi:hypothetical protein
MLAAPAAVVTATAQPAAAHTCVQVRLYVDGSMFPVGACHADGAEDPFDVCNWTDVPVSWEPFIGDTGPGWSICVEVPVAVP